MNAFDKVNILLVDDQPAKLLSYEVILRDLDETLIKACSAEEALAVLLKTEVAVVLVDVCMPDLDGFELARMIRDHPRFERTAIIFISAILLGDTDRLRGYEMGAVDYVPVPVVPEMLRAKVRVFAELYRKTRQLEQLNADLEQRVAERTAELEASAGRLLESERRRSVALEAGQMGSWDWDLETGDCLWDPGQYRIFGVEPDDFAPSFARIRPMIHPDDLARIEALIGEAGERPTFQTEVRIIRPSGEVRWCLCAAAVSADETGGSRRVGGVTIDITERKQAEERQLLLAREVDHRARNALAIVQAIIRLTAATNVQTYVTAVEGRIKALAQAHTLLSESRWHGADMGRLVEEELAPYRSGKSKVTIEGATVLLAPDRAQAVALALHELATNSAKYGALSRGSGEVRITWRAEPGTVTLSWTETGGPAVEKPKRQGFGTRIITASIEHQIGGAVDLDWQPAGLRCTLTVPCGRPAADRSDPALVPSEDGGLDLAGDWRRRVLLVEDDARRA